MRSTITPERSVLADLLTWTAGPFATIYLPFDPTRRDIERVELKAAVRTARAALVDAGLSEREADDVMAPVEVQPEEGVERCRAVAWFCAPGHAASVRLPSSAGPSVRVGPVPDTLGLAPLFVPDGHWYVLALSQQRVRLLRADRHSIEHLSVEGLPQRLDEALWYVRREPTLERHGSGAMHASDSGRELHKDDVRRFLRMVDEAIEPVLAGSEAPLVVMGVGYEAEMFIGDTHYRHVVATPVVGNPDHLDGATVRARTEPLGDGAGRLHDTVVARARELAGTGRALSAAADIADAAARGAVDDLVLAEEATTMPVGDGVLDEHRAVLAQAFTRAIAAGATCVVAPRRELPDGTDLVAVLRY